MCFITGFFRKFPATIGRHSNPRFSSLFANSCLVIPVSGLSNKEKPNQLLSPISVCRVNSECSDNLSWNIFALSC